MLHYHYLPTLVDDRRRALERLADRRRRLAEIRHAGLRFHRRPALTLAPSAVRTTAESATPQAA